VSESPARSTPKLTASLLGSHPRWEESRAARARDLPERVLQFGEGNFLRGFVDWMLERMNRQGLFNGRAVLVQPIAQGSAELINEQDGLYTLLLRGVAAGSRSEQRELVTSVSRCLDPYRDFDAVLALAREPELRFVVSNTTEAGIRLDPDDRLDARPACSFPAKLTQLLYARFQHFDADPARGWVILPCELIERNGDALERAVKQLARDWALPVEFEAWLNRSSVFTNTLVDRIITGFPKDDADMLTSQLGYQDALMVAGEVFHCWVIESPRPLEEELPLARAGLDVVWTQDMTPYRERKVRILNGAHTLVALAAFLAGKDTVRECMDDPLFRGYVESALALEILPTLTLPAAELSSFASSVLERFGNPFIQHPLLNISLNSVSKYKARLLGTVLDNQRQGRSSPRLEFALAALLAFYRGSELSEGTLMGERQGTPYPIRDEARVLEHFASVWRQSPSGACSAECCARLVNDTLARQDFWGCALNEVSPHLTVAVAGHLNAICTVGVRAALEQMLESLSHERTGHATSSYRR
jgi:tagaturonate reductase